MAITGIVYYCPELRLYRYKTSNPSDRDSEVDYKFDADELEDSLVALLAREPNEEKNAEVKFLANMTGLARVNPHKVVAFDIENDKIDVLEAGAYWKKHDVEREELVAAEEAAAQKVK